MKIFDVNLSTGQWPFRRLPLADTAEMFAKLTAQGISGGLVRSLEAPFSLNINEENELLYEKLRNFPQFIPLPAVRPDFGLWKEVTAPAAALYPSYHQYSLTSPECVAMVRALLAKNITPVIVVREEDERGQHPLCKVAPVSFDEINELAGMFPDKKFIVLNIYYYECGKLSAENVYADIAFTESFPALALPVEKLGVSRLLFGSHAPFFCIGAAVSKVACGDLNEEEQESVAYKNAEKILNGR